MIYKILLSIFAVFVCSRLSADIPADNEFTTVSVKEFNKYFSYEYGEVDGGEILLNFSLPFINSFQSDGCLISATIEVFNTEGKFTEWAQKAAMSLVNLSLESAAQQKLYVGGLGNQLKVRFTYFTNGCVLSDAGNYKSHNKIVFSFEDMKELER